MTSKKSLYQPAPERLPPDTFSSLPQGDTSQARKNVPKIKQGILEASQKGNKPLTSTLKPTKTKTQKERLKPIVVCHNPSAVHSYLKAGENSRELAEDTVASPRTVVISSQLDTTQNNSTLQKSGMKSNSRKFVQSRYKQAAANVVMGGNGSRNSNSSTMSRSKSRSVEKTKAETSTNYSFKAPKSNVGPGITSTPSSNHLPRPELDWNASAIERSQSTSFSPAKPTRNREVAPELDDTDLDDLEILTCRYLQWHYLRLSTNKEMQQKAKQATSELTFLHNKNVELDREVVELNKEIMQLEYQCELEKHLDLQQSGLAPVVDKLPSSLDPYTTLTENLDTTCHNLPLTGAHIPDQDDLECTLDETRNLLGQINILTHSQAPIMEEMSVNAFSLSKSCQGNAKAIVATKNILREETSAALKQASLVSQLVS